MRIACLSFSQAGNVLGKKIKKLSYGNKTYRIEHYNNRQLAGGIKSQMKDLVEEYDGLVFISATAIAIRFINPYIIDKSLDPAVVVVDDMGSFSISLLSGHLGGSNQLANWLAKLIGARPVITTATDNRGIEAIDLFAQARQYHMENIRDVGYITAMMVNGEKIGFYTEMDHVIKYDNLVQLDRLENIDPSIKGLILVSSSKTLGQDIPLPKCRLIPKNINIGLGCRRGIKDENIIGAIKKALDKENLSVKGLKALGTVEIKKDEEGIIKASEYFKLGLKIFSLEEIEKIEDRFEKSQFVKDTIGVYSVSEPVAYLLGGQLITSKERYQGITISISKETGKTSIGKVDKRDDKK